MMNMVISRRRAHGRPLRASCAPAGFERPESLRLACGTLRADSHGGAEASRKPHGRVLRQVSGCAMRFGNQPYIGPGPALARRFRLRLRMPIVKSAVLPLRGVSATCGSKDRAYDFRHAKSCSIHCLHRPAGALRTGVLHTCKPGPAGRPARGARSRSGSAYRFLARRPHSRSL